MHGNFHDAATARLTQRAWLFDLDNTLHDANACIFPHISHAMTAYMCEHLQLDATEAARLRQDYWRRHGATLTGLMRHHGTDPEHFLRHTHDFADLPALVSPARGLPAMLKKLPGRKILFSNAPRVYTNIVLRTLGLGQSFAAIYTIERLRFQPKPALAGFLRVLRAERLSPDQCIMVEDSLPNLKTARKLGMKTVWVNAHTTRAASAAHTTRPACLRRSPHVNVTISSILDLPGRLGQL